MDVVGCKNSHRATLRWCRVGITSYPSHFSGDINVAAADNAITRSEVAKSSSRLLAAKEPNSIQN